ncbi:DUF4227 family protein [Brevibacterium sp. JNUCC-42]|nr:DUF4227 family protein [Brevibacterium sp. JNUCC-42]
MSFPFRRFMELIRFFLLFVTCSLFSYGVVSYLSHHILPANPYREPLGNAVKVVKWLDNKPVSEWDWYLERLQLFFSEGE